MKTKAVKKGKSLAVAIPKSVVREYGVKAGDMVEYTVRPHGVDVKPVVLTKRLLLNSTYHLGLPYFIVKHFGIKRNDPLEVKLIRFPKNNDPLHTTLRLSKVASSKGFVIHKDYLTYLGLDIKDELPILLVGKNGEKPVAVKRTIFILAKSKAVIIHKRTLDELGFDVDDLVEVWLAKPSCAVYDFMDVASVEQPQTF